MLDLEEFAKKSKLFELLDEEGQKRLIGVTVEHGHGHDDVLMTEGEGGEDFYVILEGTVRVLLDDGAGGQKEVARLSRGAFLGEMGALVGEPRSATVIADGDVRSLRFESPRVQDILKDYPLVREALVKLALKRSEDNLQEMLKD